MLSSIEDVVWEIRVSFLGNNIDEDIFIPWGFLGFIFKATVENDTSTVLNGTAMYSHRPFQNIGINIFCFAIRYNIGGKKKGGEIVWPSKVIIAESY